MNLDKSHPRRLPTAIEYTENIARIRELDARMSVLKMELYLLEIERAMRCSFTAAFRRLPAELLTEIASRCIELGESPQKLNQISWSMREAVNEMKQFWSKIYLSRRRVKTKGRYKGYIQCNGQDHLQTILQRASSVTLAMAIRDPFGIRDLVAVLVPVASSIHALAVINPKSIGQLPTLQLTSLRNLALETRGNGQPEIGWIHRCLNFTPSALTKFTTNINYSLLELVLQHRAIVNASNVSLDMFEEGINLNSFHLPEVEILTLAAHPQLLQSIETRKLRHLRLDGENHMHPMYLEDLPQPDNLESLDLERVTFHSDETKRYEALNLLRLRLRLVWMPFDSKLWAPRLEDLTLLAIQPDIVSSDNDFDGEDMEIEKQELCQWLNGDFLGPVLLKHLTLGYMLLGTAIPRSLSILPELMSLRLEHCYLSKDFLVWLGNKSGRSAQILPKITEIYIVDCESGSDFEVENLVAKLAMNRPEVKVYVETSISSYL